MLGHTVAFAIAAVAIAAGVLGLSRAAASFAGPAGEPPPFAHDLEFENDTPYSADGLSVEVSEYTWQVEVVQEPDRCPTPDIDMGSGLSASARWETSCVRPGESVTLRFLGECDDCPPPDATASWMHDSLGNADCGATTDAADATIILQQAAGLVDALGCEMDADFNGDAMVDAVDAVLVLQLVAGLIAV